MDFVLTIDNPILAYGNKSRSIWVASADGSKKAVLMSMSSEADQVSHIRISSQKGIEVGKDFSLNNKTTDELKSELKESEDYIAVMKAQPVPPRRELSYQEKKVAKLKALIAIREGKTEFQQTADEIVADTPDAQLATEAAIKALTDSGIEVVEATDEMAMAVLEVGASNVELQTINDKFNAELQQQIDGTLPQGHIYQLGMPSKVLLATGIANAPIQLNSQRLLEKSSNFGHNYGLYEIKDLVKAISTPIAIFTYGDKSKAQNIVVEIHHEDKNFIVGLSIQPTVGGQGLNINSIRNVFPKDNAEWLNWIAQGKALFLNKEKIQTLINQQRTNLADVEYLDLDSVANIVQNFENPNIEAQIFGGNSGYVGYSMSKRAAEAREEGRYPKTDFKRVYRIPQSTLDALVKVGVIDNTEWHHTSMYGNRTVFYGWNEPWYGDAYAENKKEIDRLIKEQPINADAIESLFENAKAKGAYENAQRAKQAEREIYQAFKVYDSAIRQSNLPEEYTASNGVVIVTNGQTLPYQWDGFYNGNKAWKKWRDNAVVELIDILKEKNKSNPTYEQWRAESQGFINEIYAKHNATPVEFLRTPPRHNLRLD